MAWNDCDNGGGREDKVSSRDQEERGHRGCAGNCYFGGDGQNTGTKPGGAYSRRSVWATCRWTQPRTWVNHESSTPKTDSQMADSMRRPPMSDHKSRRLRPFSPIGRGHAQ